MMYTSKYLVSILSLDNSNWSMVGRNHQIDHNKWGRFSRMFYQDMDDTRTSGMFYLVMVKYVLLFWS